MINVGAFNLSRRAVLGASAAAAVAGIGGAALFVRGPKGLINDILKRAIGPFEMSTAHRTRLLDDTYAYLQSVGAKDLSLRVMGGGYAALNFPFVRHLLPEGGLFKIEQLERQVVTYFLSSTDYLNLTDGKADKAEQAKMLVSYLEFTGVCATPWARTS